MATITTAGAVPSSPTTLLNEVVTAATALAPGLTTTLPGSLVEDMSSTATGAVIVQDQGYVDLINSISAVSANAPVLYQLGQMYGIPQGQGSNTSVYVLFLGTPGFVIARGFVVSDGINQYVIQDGGIVGSSGQSALLYALAINSGSFAVPAGTVTQIITSVPTGITLSVTNPSTGIPGTTAQTLPQYQAQVVQAGQAVAQGMPTFLKTQLQKVSGVQPRLTAVRQMGTYWEVIVGGGDPYLVANAIFTGLFDISNLVGSSIYAFSITNATNAVINTGSYLLNYSVGQSITISGATPSAFNTTYVITAISGNLITTSTNTTTFGSYTSGTGLITLTGTTPPNNGRNITVSINDYPDTYSITFVDPPAETVTLALTWNTISTNYVSPTAVSTAAIPAIVAYINSIAVGQPINTYELQNTFQTAVASIVSPTLISKIDFVIEINGQTVSPATGTGMIYGDPESFFETTNALVTVAQG